MNSDFKIKKSKKNIFANMGFTDTEAKELQFRSFLMTVLEKYIEKKGLTQKEAAEELGVTQSRVSNIVHGKIDLFSSSMLLSMIEKAGFPIYENIQANAPTIFLHVDLPDVITENFVSEKYRAVRGIHSDL